MNLKKRIKAIYIAIKYGFAPLPEVPAGHVVIIETDTDNLNVALGITEERFNELIEPTREIFEKYEDTSLMLRDISKLACHANELAMMSYIIGSAVCKRREEERMKHIISN